MADHVLLAITICEKTYGIAIDEVVEVAALVEAAPLGGDDYPAVHGVVIRRGEPMLLVDLRRVFGCPQHTATVDTLFVVVRNLHESVGFLVDNVQGVVYLPYQAMRPMAGNSGHIRGVAAHDGKLVQWLHMQRLIDDTLPADE